jgi:hypothetical protein
MRSVIFCVLCAILIHFSVSAQEYNRSLNVDLWDKCLDLSGLNM